jgi:lysozyme
LKPPRRKPASAPRPRKTSSRSGKAWIWAGISGFVIIAVYLLLNATGYDPFFRFGIEKSYKRYEAFGIHIPTRHAIHGIDVSRHQGGINWSLVKAMQVDSIRIRFAFIKATQGIMLRDRYFQYNWQEAKKHGIIRGAYHYFSPDTDPLLQARHFCRTVKLEPGDLPPVLDVEERGSLTREELSRRVQVWMDHVERETGVTPILYSGKRFYEDQLRDWLETKYPLWIAHYHVPALRMETSERWQFWQHSDRGRADGIGHRVDFNVFYGEEEEWKEMLVR